MSAAARPALPRRPLGKTGFSISEVGFGGWGIGKSMWGRTDDHESLRALRAALDAGVNYFDTAHAYGHGHSERLISQALRESGKEAVVATKIPPKNMEWPARGSTRLAHAFPADWVAQSTERSLRNLRVERIDLQQFHVWNDAWLRDPSWPETLEALARLRAQGKILRFGVSVNSDDPDSALEIARSGHINSAQILFNLFDQRAADRLFPACRERGVGIIARCPFDEGGLTGALTLHSRFPAEDFRSHYFGGDRLAQTCRRADALQQALVGRHALDLADAALKFCLSFDAVSTVIPGMRTPAHVAANVRSADGKYFDAALIRTLQAHAWVRDFYR